MGLLISCLCLALRSPFHNLTHRGDAWQAPEGSSNHPSSAPLYSHCSPGFNSASLSSRSLTSPSCVSHPRAHSAPVHAFPSSALPCPCPKRKCQSLPTSRPSDSGVLPFWGWDPGNLCLEYSTKNVLPPTPNPPVLSSEVVVLGDEAISKLETIRPRQLQQSEPSPQPEKNCLQTITDEALQEYFSAAIDAKNALQLRKAAVTIDIGEALQALLPSLSLYDRDAAVLCTAGEEIQAIENECLRRGLRLNFYALERLRSLFAPYQQSLVEEHSLLFLAVGTMVEEKGDARLVAQRFFDDPSALREYRLPRFSSMVR